MAQNSVTVAKVLKAPASSVFKAWVEPKLLELWGVTRAKTEPKVGGKYRFETETGDGSDDLHVVTGEYREFVPGRRLVMTWVYDGPAAKTTVETLVTVIITESGKGSVKLSVTESGPSLSDDASREDSKTAWTSVMANLEALLTTALRK